MKPNVSMKSLVVAGAVVGFLVICWLAVQGDNTALTAVVDIVKGIFSGYQ